MQLTRNNNRIVNIVNSHVIILAFDSPFQCDVRVIFDAILQFIENMEWDNDVHMFWLLKLPEKNYLSLIYHAFFGWVSILDSNCGWPDFDSLSFVCESFFFVFVSTKQVFPHRPIRILSFAIRLQHVCTECFFFFFHWLILFRSACFFFSLFLYVIVTFPFLFVKSTAGTIHCIFLLLLLWPVNCRMRSVHQHILQ